MLLAKGISQKLILMIFHVVLLLLGIYLLFVAKKVKRTHEVGDFILPQEDLRKIKDKKGFAEHMSGRIMILGIVCIIAGAVGCINYFVGMPAIFVMAVLLVLTGTFVWFTREVQDSKTKF